MISTPGCAACPTAADVRADAHRPGGEDDLAGLDRAGLLEAEVGLPLLDGLLCVVVELAVDRAGVVAERLQVLLELEHVAALDSVLEAPPGGKVADEEHDRALVDAVEDVAAAARGALGREGGDRAARPGGEALRAGEAERAAERLGAGEVAAGDLRGAGRHGPAGLVPAVAAADVRQPPGGDRDAGDRAERRRGPRRDAVANAAGAGASRCRRQAPAAGRPRSSIEPLMTRPSWLSPGEPPGPPPGGPRPRSLEDVPGTPPEPPGNRGRSGSTFSPPKSIPPPPPGPSENSGSGKSMPWSRMHCANSRAASWKAWRSSGSNLPWMPSRCERHSSWAAWKSGSFGIDGAALAHLEARAAFAGPPRTRDPGGRRRSPRMHSVKARIASSGSVSAPRSSAPSSVVVAAPSPRFATCGRVGAAARGEQQRRRRRRSQVQ